MGIFGGGGFGSRLGGGCGGGFGSRLFNGGGGGGGFGSRLFGGGGGGSACNPSPCQQSFQQPQCSSGPRFQMPEGPLAQRPPGTFMQRIGDGFRNAAGPALALGTTIAAMSTPQVPPEMPISYAPPPAMTSSVYPQPPVYAPPVAGDDALPLSATSLNPGGASVDPGYTTDGSDLTQVVTNILEDAKARRRKQADDEGDEAESDEVAKAAEVETALASDKVIEADGLRLADAGGVAGEDQLSDV